MIRMLDIIKVRIENNKYDPGTRGGCIASMTDALLIEISIMKFGDNMLWLITVSNKL